MIEDYGFGRVVVDGTAYTSDVIIYPDRVDDGWWRKEGHRLCMADLEEALASNPDVIVVGTGAHGVMAVPDDVRQQLSDKGIDLRTAKTAQACEIYNETAHQKRAVAALHLTC
jgi:hypothetical protein